MAQIFLPFEQVSDPGLRSKGTGLGLSITRSLVDQMSGTLEVQSRLGAGTIFDVTLTLPVIWVSTQPVAISNLAVNGYEGRRRAVLIVDDEPHNRDLLANLLSPLGFDVVEAAHGAAALDLAKSRWPDIVLLDLLMPEMDGFEVARKLRLMSDPEDGQMTIIAISANAFEQQMLESKLAECDAFLAKPIDVDRLLSLLQVHADLTWLSDEDSERTYDRLDQSSGAEKTLVLPESDDLAVLIDLAMKGELPGLMKAADKLADEDSSYRPFADHLRPLVDDFDEEGVWSLLNDALATQSPYPAA